MKNKITPLISLLFVCLFIINGCSTTPGYFDIARHASTSSAVVYIYRPNSMANVMVSPDVVIDGNKNFALGNNYYHVVQVAEGTHQISLDLAERYQGNNNIILETKSGQDYFLRISTKVKFQKNKPYDRWFILERVSAPEARKEIALCKPYVPEIKQEASEAVKQESKESEYSSQKFNNPFSK